MPSDHPERDNSSTQYPRSNTSRYATWFLAGIALIYALLAGLHTVQDFDLPWQLATGRWVAQHHQIFSTDVFSYTAHGEPWIYPVLSGIVFYLVYLAGGYALLSWMGAAACAGTMALLLRRNNVAACSLALIAVPLVANRTQPRAEMFTTILFAAFLSLLWHHYRATHQSDDSPVRSRLWLLPLLMVAWVNLHPGFISGIALCGAYVLLEVLDLFVRERRSAVRARLQRAWPWLALTAAATLANPWGVFIYRALVRQQQAQNLHNLWIVEWEGIHPSWNSLRQALNVRDSQSAFWWLLAIALLSPVVALWRRRWGATALLLVSVYFAVQHGRLEALFACVTVIVGGSLLDEAWKSRNAAPLAKPRKKKTALLPQAQSSKWIPAALLLLTTALTSLAGIRCWDLATNRYYLKSTQLSVFGAGLSWWFPERAFEFVEREKLPANIFNGYSLGGYVTWRVFPNYPDYIDSRALPFGSQLFFRAYDLSSAEPPDSPAWQQEANARNINTIVVSLARYDGIALFPQLRAFCQSQFWRPVYMDDVSAVFVRRIPQTASLIDRLQIDCDKVSFPPPAELQSDDAFQLSNSRRRADLFNFWANSGEILYTLGRYPEALTDLDRAQSIFSDNSHLHLIRGLLLEHTRHAPEAEAEFRTSLSLEPSDQSWLVLGLFYMAEKRYADATEVFRRSAESSSRPHDSWMLLGQAYLQINQPQPALDAFDNAEASSPFAGEGESLGTNFHSMVATGRAKAWYQLGDLRKAVSFQEEAVKLAPNDTKLWLGLADLYDAQGRKGEAAQARAQAQARASQDTFR
jgi:Flp pilus assembly protein TadD